MKIDDGPLGHVVEPSAEPHGVGVDGLVNRIGRCTSGAQGFVVLDHQAQPLQMVNKLGRWRPSPRSGFNVQRIGKLSPWFTARGLQRFQNVCEHGSADRDSHQFTARKFVAVWKLISTLSPVFRSDRPGVAGHNDACGLQAGATKRRKNRGQFTNSTQFFGPSVPHHRSALQYRRQSIGRAQLCFTSTGKGPGYAYRLKVGRRSGIPTG
jgi:hypothetical protein